jgi:hypothetical protein
MHAWMDGWSILEDDYLRPGYGILGRDCIEILAFGELCGLSKDRLEEIRMRF